MVKFALLVTMDAKPGKEAEVEAFLRSGQPGPGLSRLGP